MYGCRIAASCRMVTPQDLDTFNQGYEVISMVRTANKSAGFVKNLTSGLFYKILNKISEVHFEENASDFFAITKKPAEVLKKHFRETSRFSSCLCAKYWI